MRIELERTAEQRTRSETLHLDHHRQHFSSQHALTRHPTPHAKTGVALIRIVLRQDITGCHRLFRDICRCDIDQIAILALIFEGLEE
jgi:hypothetical protein